MGSFFFTFRFLPVPVVGLIFFPIITTQTQPPAMTGEKETKRQKHFYPSGMVMTQTNPGTSPENKLLYNSKEIQGDVVAGKKLDWYDYGARFYDAQIGRFHTQDRFAEKYFALSPYQYGGNNPISFIDINGDSIWYVNPMGIVTHSEIGARNYAGTHTLYALNDKGEKTGDPINVKDGSILDQLATDRPETKRDRNKIYHDYFPDGVRYAETTYREETFKLFHFFANHTEVEWAINGFITEGMKDYIIATGHSERFAPNPWYGDDGKFPGRDLRTLNFRIHSHQAHNSLGGGPSSGDKDGWRDIRTRLGSFREPPPHYVYEVKEQRLYWYGGYSGQKGVTRLTIRHFSDLYRHLGF
jgi:RHS repeat-associated protein